MQLGFPDDGHLTNYYPDSTNITKSDIVAVGDFLEQKGLLVVGKNTLIYIPVVLTRKLGKYKIEKDSRRIIRTFACLGHQKCSFWRQ